MAPCLDVKGGRQASRGASKRANAEERAPNAGYAWPEAFGAVCGSMRIGGIEVEEEGSRRGPLQITSITSQRLTATWVMTSVMHERSRPLGMPVAWIEPTSQAPPIYRKEDTNRRFASLSQRALVKRRVHTQGSGSCTTGGRWNRRLSSSRQAVHRTTSDGRRPGTPRAAQCLRECIRSSCSAT